jgi:hypothetical protein
MISTPLRLSPRAKSTKPVLSETLMSARVIFFKLSSCDGQKLSFERQQV